MAFARSVCLALFLGLITPVFGADDNMVISPRSVTRGETPAATTSSSFNSLSLLAALALAGGGGWMVWRNRRGTAAGRDARNLSVEETRSLGNRQYLVVASYEGKKFLLGVCPGRIDMLSSLGELRDARLPGSRE
jgi:flagellar protein FliO/FliZ